MLKLQGTFELELVAQVAELETLGQVAALWPIVSVVIQDEFTHDVVAGLPDGRALVFDAT